jgi:serine-type D-Ala-D-Ala carboxypeptidase
MIGLLCVVGTALLQGPDSARVSPADPLASVDHVVRHGLAAGGFPGLAVVVGRHDTTLLAAGYGRVDWRPTSAAVEPARTMYDLASLTKVVATATGAMILYDRGRLDLDAPVSRYLSAWRGADKQWVTIGDLLTHRSGLPAGRDLPVVADAPEATRRAARRAVLATPLAFAPETRFIYSDLGPDVLGFVIEAIVHEPLDVFLTDAVYRPLGMSRTRFRPPPATHADLARTEAPLGRVHDRNAAALGGVAGHAGLFATATDLATFARLMLDRGTYRGVRLVSDSAVERFTTRAAGTRALGWDTCAGGASCGQYMSPRAYGHTGYTGTSMWIDPDRDLFVIVLANWASGTPDHPTGPEAILADVRADIADLAVAAVMPGGDSAIGSRGVVALRSDGARGWKLQ